MPERFRCCPLLERFGCPSPSVGFSVAPFAPACQSRRAAPCGSVATPEALAQRAADETRLAQLTSEQGIPANLYPDPNLPLTGPLTSMTKDVVEHSKAEPTAPRTPPVAAITASSINTPDSCTAYVCERSVPSVSHRHGHWSL